MDGPENSSAVVAVKATTLDAFVAEQHVVLDEIALVKVDTQGSEGRILAGALEVLEAPVPWLMEFWPEGLRAAGTSPDNFVSIVQQYFGFCYELPRRGPPVRLEMGQVRQLFTKYAADFCNLLLLRDNTPVVR